jgi:hypothetical protein
MPDLSKVLGDVYGDHEKDELHVPLGSKPGPAWANEDRLDAAFQDWTPGPAADASHAEKRLFAGPVSEPRPLDPDLAAALSEALAEAPATVVPEIDGKDDVAVHVAEGEPFEGVAPTAWAPPDPTSAVPPPATLVSPGPTFATPAPAPVVEAPLPEPPAAEVPNRAWQRSDDDILPGKGRGRGRRMSMPSLPSMSSVSLPKLRRK